MESCSASPRGIGLRAQRRACRAFSWRRRSVQRLSQRFVRTGQGSESSQRHWPIGSRRLPAEESHRWDRLELAGVDATDVAFARLLEHLQTHGNVVHHCPTFNGWRVALPATWDEYLMILSKPHRNRLRRAYRNYFETGRVTVRHAHSPEEIAQAFADFDSTASRPLEIRAGNPAVLPRALSNRFIAKFRRD